MTLPAADSLNVRSVHVEIAELKDLDVQKWRGGQNLSVRGTLFSKTRQPPPINYDLLP